MSYVIDVFRKDVPLQRNIFKLGLYIVLFPQLIAGPIVRYKDISNEIDNRNNTLEDFSNGIERFILGLGKKAIIANTMAVTADKIWGQTDNIWLIAWIGSIAYMLQIYFDFSGYSDMAIGLGRMFGFHFNENFNLPYTSHNITEFWRRWHISLSSWFRDYVYIPLGGNRKNVYLNLSIVFLLTGIWHGASWHFIIWGIYNGVFILLERALKVNANSHAQLSIEEKKWDLSPITIFSKIYTLLVVNFGWVLFRATGMRDAYRFFLTMFGLRAPENVGFSVLWYLDKWTLTIMIIGILFASSVPTRIGMIIKAHMNKKVYVIVKNAILLSMLYLSMIRIVSGTYNPFIYFKF